MSLFIDYLVELGLDVGKDYLIDKKMDMEIKKSVLDYIRRQNNINEICDLAEEIDFQGISKYIISNLLPDVKVYLFGNVPDREAMKETIYSKAICYSKADTKKQENKVKKLIDDSLDILYNYYRMQIKDTDWFMSAEMIDTMIKKLKKELDKNKDSISEKIESGNKRIIEEIHKIKEDGCIRMAENVLIRQLHEFIMKKYIKEKYREEELSGQDIEVYSNLFKLCIDIYDDKGKASVDKNIFDFVKDVILNQEKENLIKIAGPDGTGKNTFLSILYMYLYRYCLDEGFSFCPFYINLHFYDTVTGNSVLDEQEIKNIMYKDLEKLKILVQTHPHIPYIIIIDGNENYFRTTLKTAKYFNDYINDFSAHKKIVCIGESTNIYIYRERKKYTYMYSRMLYTFKFKSISRFEKNSWKAFISNFTKIDGNSDLLGDINNYLGKFDLDEVDLNILNVFKKCYDSDVLSGLDSISDLYKNYCMAYLRDTDDFEDSARMSYEYFMTNKKFSQYEIAKNNRKWNLIHQHKTISNFLIAYYYVGKIKNFSGKDDISELEYLFTKDVNRFIKPLINENLEIQELILDKCKQVYEEGHILAKSQVIYMMGRITHKSLRADILSTLENYYNDLYKQLICKKVMWTEQEERDAHLLLRSVSISLVYLGKKDKMEAYLKMLLNYPVANQINRGFHLEYYGDVPRKPDSRMYNYNDDGTNSIDITYNVLLDKVEQYLSSKEGKEDLNFQINLFTLCSLVQARLGKDYLNRECMQKIKEVINLTLKKEQGNINIDFRAYLTMLTEDIDKESYFPYFLYEKLYGIKNIVRKGWEQEIKNDVIDKPYENVAEHIYYTWMMGMLYLPEEPPKEIDYKDYDKRKVLDAVLIHDWAEVDVGDAVPSEDTEKRRELEDFRMRVLLMHDTYSYIGNMLQYKKVWDVYNRGKSDINGKIAYELDKIQALYQFYQYRSEGAEFTDEKVLDWENEKNKITTSIGKKILKEIVQERISGV